MTSHDTATTSGEDDPRREKLRRIEELGCDPWGGRFDDRQLISEIRQYWTFDRERLDTALRGFDRW